MEKEVSQKDGKQMKSFSALMFHFNTKMQQTKVGVF